MLPRFRDLLALATIAGALCYSSTLSRSGVLARIDSGAAPSVSNPVQALCNQLVQKDAKADCLPSLKTGDKTVRSLIAIVADPKRTNLALDFDRSVEALIWALADVKYTLQDYWLPWNNGRSKQGQPGPDAPHDSSSGDANDAPDEPSAQQGYQPGFLLFRGEDLNHYFVVWLVGDSPTTGVEIDALAAAIHNVQEYDQQAGDIRIVGPSFSGSFSSLADALNKEPGKFRVLNGMATSFPAQQAFIREVPASKLEFKSTVENVSYALGRFVAYLRRHWITTGEIAILAEDQTAYGQAIQADVARLAHAQVGGPEQWLLIRFPREIARLRNTYETESGKTATAQTPSSSAPPQDSLPFSLRSSGEGTDNVPDFSREQTPLSQEAVLLDIANSLQHEHVRYAGILATDVLDQIFLVRFLTRACPDVRLVLFDADLLFARAELTTSLEGVLNVTTYPLFLRNQHWTEAQLKGELPQRIPFASRSAEGVYNATRAQLWNAGLKGDGEVMLDYFHPDSNPAWHPPLWLTVLGRTGYWPVALLDEETATAEEKKPGSSLMQWRPPVDRPHERLHPETPSPGWALALIVIAILGVLHCSYFWLVYRPSMTGRPSERWSMLRKFLYTIFWFYPSRPKPAFTRLLLIVTVALAAVELVFATSGVPYEAEKTGATFMSELLYLILPLASFGLLIIVAWQLSRNVGLKHAAPSWVLALLVAGLWLFTVSGSPLDNMRIYFFAYRLLQPSSGASPGPPVLLLLIVCASWALVQLAREPGAEIPDIPPLSDPSKETQDLNDWLKQVLPRAFLGYSLILIMMLFWNRLHSVEDRSYDALVNLLVILCYFLMFSTWTQLLIAWWYFRRFLESLERHPMRDAFSRLPKELATMPLIRKGRQKPFIMASARCLDTLAALSAHPIVLKNPGAHSEYATLAAGGRDAMERLLALRREGKGEELYKHQQIREAKEQLEKTIFAGAKSLVDQAEDTLWQSGKSESVEDEEDSDKRVKHPAPSDEETLQILIEEFIALRLVMYILHVLRQMHKMMWFVVMAFVLTVLAMNVYPFKSPRLIDFSSIVMLAVLAVGTSIVLAQMDRDSILSRLTATTPNQIGKNFFFRLASFGALPVITVLSTQFPSIRNLLFSWIQPALQALSNSG